MADMYNTGNALGSNDLKDLSDNAIVFDRYANSDSPSVTDRFSRRRETIAGMNARFSGFIDGIGFSYAGEYAAGLTLSSRLQYVVREGVEYRLAPSTTLPYTLTGTWATDQSKLIALQRVDSFAIKNVQKYGVVADNKNDCRKAFQDFLDSLDEFDAFYIPPGTYYLSGPLSIPGKGVTIFGAGIDVTVLRFAGSGDGVMFSDASSVSVPIHSWQMRDLTVAKDGIGGTGIGFTRTNKSSNPTIPSALLENVLVRGYSDIGAQYWDTGVYEKNGASFRFQNVAVIANGPTMTHGMLLENDPDASRYNITLNGINIQGGVTGLEVTGHCENFRLQDYEIVGQGTSIFMNGIDTSISGGKNPVALIANGHANAKTYTIRCENWKVIDIMHADTYSGVGTDDTDGENILIRNADFVTVKGGKIGTGAIGKARSGVALQNVTDAVIDSTFEYFPVAGVTANGNSDRISVSGIISGYAQKKTSSGVYVASSNCRVTAVGLTLENCTKGLEGLGGGSLLDGLNFKNCDTDIVWAGDNFTIGTVQSSNTPAKFNLSGSTNYHRSLRRSVSIDPPAVAPNSRQTLLVNFPEAAFGDSVSVAAPYDLTDLQVTAAVQAPGMVAIYFRNDTGAAKDLDPGIWFVKVER